MARRGHGNAGHEPRDEELGIHAMDGFGGKLKYERVPVKGHTQREHVENSHKRIQQ